MGRRGMHIEDWWGSQNERYHYEDQDIGWLDTIKMDLRDRIR
jgi:hypothetical protein